MRLIASIVVLLVSTSCIRSDDSLARFVPEGAIFFGEIKSLSPIAERFQSDDWKKIVENSKQYQDYRKSDNYERVQAAIKIVEGVVGMDAESLAKKLVSTQAAVGLFPPEDGKKELGVVAVIYYPERELWAKLRPQLEAFITIANAGKMKRETIAGRQVVSLDGKLFYFAESDVVVISNRKPLIEKASPLGKSDGKGSLANNSAYRDFDKRSHGNVGRFYFDNKKACSLVPTGRLIPEKTDNFVIGTLLLQDATELLATCDIVGGAIDADDKGLRITATIPGKPTRLGETFAGFLLSPDKAGGAPLPPVKGLMSGLTVHRDIKALYAQRENLIREAQLPEFDKFESGLNNIIPGKNFSEDLLPMLGQQITLIAANRDFTGNAQPTIKLPAFAMVLELAKPKEGSEFFQLFFQAIVPILNFTAKESGNKPQLISMENHNGVSVYYSRYLEEPTGTNLPIQFNFRVASAAIGDHYIFATSSDLCKELVDYFKNPVERIADGRNVVWNVMPSEVARSLLTNIDTLVAGQIREGKPAKQARQELELFIGAIEKLGKVELFTRVRPDDFQISLEANWK